MAKPPERQYRDNDGGRSDDDKYQKQDKGPLHEEREDRPHHRDDDD